MSSSTGSQKLTGKHIGNAILSTLFLIFLNLFVMPYNIWAGATIRLSKLRESGIIAEMRKTELVVFSWLKLLFDCLIFLSYILAPILIIAALNAPRRFGRVRISEIPGLIIMVFFAPVVLSLIKEIIAIALIQVTKIEEIEVNTRKQEEAPID